MMLAKNPFLREREREKRGEGDDLQKNPVYFDNYE